MGKSKTLASSRAVSSPQKHASAYSSQISPVTPSPSNRRVAKLDSYLTRTLRRSTSLDGSSPSGLLAHHRSSDNAQCDGPSDPYPSLLSSGSTSVVSPQGRPDYSEATQASSAPNSKGHAPLVPPQKSVKRWDGNQRMTFKWDFIHRDPELWFADGDCLVFLHEHHASQRGPAMRVFLGDLQASNCHVLLDRCLVNSRQETAYSNRHPDGSPIHHRQASHRKHSHHRHSTSLNRLEQTTKTSAAPLHELYIPAPSHFSRDEIAAYHLTTRNIFAWLYNCPVVGHNLGPTLIALHARLKEYRFGEEDTMDEMLAFLDDQGYADLRQCPDHALAVLQYAEHFQTKDLWIDAFVHCTGMYEYLDSSSEFEKTNRSTAALMTRAHIDMQIRLERAGRDLGNFLDDSLSGTYLGLSRDAQQHLETFRSFLHSYHVGQHSYWPPPSERPDSDALPHEIYRSMYFDIRSVYELLADKQSTSDLQQNNLVDGGICVHQNIMAFDRRNRFTPLPHPLPLIPVSVDSTRDHNSFGLKKVFGNRRNKQDRRVTDLDSLVAATNANVDLVPSETGLVQSYLKFERQWTLFGEDTTISCADARKVRWILIYALMQSLVSVTRVPSEVRDTEGVMYPLCVQVTGLPPWSSNASDAENVNSPLPRNVSLKDMILETGPDLDLVRPSLSIGPAGIAAAQQLPNSACEDTTKTTSARDHNHIRSSLDCNLPSESVSRPRTKVMSPTPIRTNSVEFCQPRNAATFAHSHAFPHGHPDEKTFRARSGSLRSMAPEVHSQPLISPMNEGFDLDPAIPRSLISPLAQNEASALFLSRVSSRNELALTIAPYPASFIHSPSSPRATTEFLQSARRDSNITFETSADPSTSGLSVRVPRSLSNPHSQPASSPRDSVFYDACSSPSAIKAVQCPVVEQSCKDTTPDPRPLPTVKIPSADTLTPTYQCSPVRNGYFVDPDTTSTTRALSPKGLAHCKAVDSCSISETAGSGSGSAGAWSSNTSEDDLELESSQASESGKALSTVQGATSRRSDRATEVHAETFSSAFEKSSEDDTVQPVTCIASASAGARVDAVLAQAKSASALAQAQWATAQAKLLDPEAKGESASLRSAEIAPSSLDLPARNVDTNSPTSIPPGSTTPIAPSTTITPANNDDDARSVTTCPQPRTTQSVEESVPPRVTFAPMVRQYDEIYNNVQDFDALLASRHNSPVPSALSQGGQVRKEEGEDEGGEGGVEDKENQFMIRYRPRKESVEPLARKPARIRILPNSNFNSDPNSMGHRTFENPSAPYSGQAGRSPMSVSTPNSPTMHHLSFYRNRNAIEHSTTNHPPHTPHDSVGKNVDSDNINNNNNIDANIDVSHHSHVEPGIDAQYLDPYSFTQTVQSPPTTQVHAQFYSQSVSKPQSQLQAPAFTPALSRSLPSSPLHQARFILAARQVEVRVPTRMEQV